jgi:hypothetical protein
VIHARIATTLGTFALAWLAVSWYSHGYAAPPGAGQRLRLIEGDHDMGKHEDKDKAEEQRKIDSNGHKPGRGIPAEDPGGKHGKPNDTDTDDQGEKDAGT